MLCYCLTQCFHWEFKYAIKPMIMSIIRNPIMRYIALSFIQTYLLRTHVGCLYVGLISCSHIIVVVLSLHMTPTTNVFSTSRFLFVKYALRFFPLFWNAVLVSLSKSPSSDAGLFEYSGFDCSRTEDVTFFLT